MDLLHPIGKKNSKKIDLYSCVTSPCLYLKVSSQGDNPAFFPSATG